jgi:hypothetical protein
MSRLWAWRSRLLAALAVAPIVLVVLDAAPAGAASTWVRGDVFVGVGNGSYSIFDAGTGALKETISDGLGGTTTGCTFNGDQSKLYTTNWDLDKVEVYDGTSHALVQTLNTSTVHNESVVFAADGTFYVSHPGGGFDHYTAAGVLLGTLAVRVRSDWMDLSTDQRTMYFSDEGSTIHRWDMVSNTRLPDFATVP